MSFLNIGIYNQTQLFRCVQATSLKQLAMLFMRATRMPLLLSAKQHSKVTLGHSWGLSSHYTSFAKARQVYKLISATSYKNYMPAENLAEFVQEAVALLWGWSWAVCEAALLGLNLGTPKIAGDNFLMLRQLSAYSHTSKAAFLLMCKDGVKKGKTSLMSLVKGNEKGTLGPVAGWGRRLSDKGHRKHQSIQCLLHLFCEW